MTTSASKKAIDEKSVGQKSLERAFESEPDQQLENASEARNKHHETMPTPKPALANRLVIFWLCSTLIVSTLAYGAVHVWSLALLYCAAVLIALLWFADAWKMKAVRYNNSLLQLPLIGVFILGVIQLLPLGGGQMGDGVLTIAPVRTLSLNPFATRMTLVQIISVFIFFAAALAFIDTRKRLKLVARVIIVFGFVLAIEGLVQHFSSPTSIYGWREPNQANPFGPFINRGHFAACMEMIIGLSLGVLTSGGIKRDQRLLYAFMVAVMFIAMFMTGSRASLLVTLALVVFLFGSKMVLNRGNRLSESDDDDEEGVSESLRVKFGKFVIGSVLALVALCVFLLAALSLGGAQSISRMLNLTTAEDPTGGGRPHYWNVALQIIKDHPIMGVGLEGFGVAFPQYDTLNGTFRIERAHNDYLQTLTDTGIIGGLFALFFLVMLFRYGFARYKTATDKFSRGVCVGALTGCFAALLHSMFEFPLRTTSNALLFLILAALATVEVYRETVKRHKART